MGLAPRYRSIRHELCDNFLTDLDIQWFCVGILAVILSPWLPILVIMVRHQFPDKHVKPQHDNTSTLAPTEAATAERADLYRKNPMAPGGKILAAPHAAGPAAAQAFRKAVGGYESAFPSSEMPLSSLQAGSSMQTQKRQTVQVLVSLYSLPSLARFLRS